MSVIIFNAKTGLKPIRRAPNLPSDGDDFPEPHMERRDPLGDLGAGIWWCVLYSLCAFLVFAVVVVAAK